LSYNGKLDERTSVESARKIIALAIEEYAPQPKWISVKERLPEPDEKVIGVNSTGTVDVGYWNAEYDDLELNDSWFLNATHWQPLPTPPTK